ncbi:NupC/NupG family nucleoside CNT transporter [Planctomycetaceae bacterium SH139]
MLASRLVCVLGMLLLVALAWLLSTQRRKFPWRIVVGGLGLQLVLGFLILRTETGRRAFGLAGQFFDKILSFVSDGSGFLFRQGTEAGLLETFAFGVLPTVIFFSALMSVLYHLGVMQCVVWAMAWVMRFTLGTSGAETLAAAANVFVGHTEAPLVVKPYLATMTRSELNALMTGGFATVTGGLLGAYAGMGIDIRHLLTASVISAPAALLIAKVMVPETAVPVAGGGLRLDRSSGNVNLIGAAVQGATDGLKLALNVGAVLIAFLALIAMLDWMVGQAGVGFWSVWDYWQGGADVAHTPWSLGLVLGYACAPLALCMGIPWSESVAAGELIGLKTVANEFIAFKELGAMNVVASGPVEAGTISARTKIILTYALAGFSNFGAIGIQVGGIGGLEPSRRDDLARLGLRAMIGGLIACCMTGAVAGLMLAAEDPAG